MIRPFAAVASALLLAVSSPVAAQATLQVSGGILTGATGVNVDGSLYDVSFVDGTCAAVYGTCDPAHFDFTDLSHAHDAAVALLNQVFIDGPAGDFDSHPEDIFGCVGTPDVCHGVVPYANDPVFYDLSKASLADNWSDPADGVTDIAYMTEDSTADEQAVYARFTLEQSLPEPSTWLSMLLGFAFIGGFLRHGRKQNAFSIL
jgi:hypothetical protein